MRSFLLFSLIFGSALALWTSAQIPMKMGQDIQTLWNNLSELVAADSSSSTEDAGLRYSADRIYKLEFYEDPDYGFSVAVPVGWQKIVTAESNNESIIVSASDSGDNSTSTVNFASLAPGYAVGFESTQQSESDPFAEYILIEILPGRESGLFKADVALRKPITIDGKETWFDRLEINQVDSGTIDVNLVVYQAQLSGVGYTVGLYAIGEPVREQLLATAFEVMLQTFKIERDPFPVS